MQVKRMPKKPVKKQTAESDDNISVESDTYNSETDEVSSQVSNANQDNQDLVEDQEEIEESSDEVDGYLETENESEQELHDGEVKDELECDYDEERVDEQHTKSRVAKEDRITRPVLTKYEKVRVLGIRAKQISVGAKVYIKGVGNKTPYEIAELELANGLIPFLIKRPLPDDTYEIWKISELEVK
jgi:DNA-directed RNA polymerase I, II, and III subunit RPABC2